MKHSLSVVLAIVLTLCLCVGLCSCKDDIVAQVDPTDDNYRVFYQIFVGSFSDSDGDGIGDIRGIINRMDYLNDGDINSGKSLGVQGIWLSPIFTSPSYHKYDVTNYYEIDSQFGTEEDLKELLEICHERNVKVILDLVINHSSNRNQWFLDFKTARQNNDVDNEYYDFYSCVTSDEKVNGLTYYKISNSDYYYEGNFSSDMPEFNYDNEAVREKMVDVAKYWLDLGVDGFRFDAIKYIYYGETTKSAQFWDWYMTELRKIKPDIYTVGECWSADNEVLQYYSAMNCFDFTTSGTTGGIYAAVRSQDINKFTNYVELYQQSILAENDQAMYVPFLANHDMDRAAGFYPVSTGSAYMAANLYLLCCGSPFIYYGEEIGMKGQRKSDNTDANRRLAMLWGDGDTVQDPEGATFDVSDQINGTVAEQLEAEDSLLNYYAKVIAMRIKYPEIARGIYTAIKLSQSGVGGFSISYNDSVLCLLHNVSGETVEIDLPEGFTELCDFVGLDTAKVSNGKLIIGPQTSVILK